MYRNTLWWLSLTWTSWNLDKHNIVKDSADIVVSWPWNNICVGYWQTDSKSSSLSSSTVLLSYNLNHECVHFRSDVFVCKKVAILWRLNTMSAWYQCFRSLNNSRTIFQLKYRNVWQINCCNITDFKAITLTKYKGDSLTWVQHHKILKDEPLKRSPIFVQQYRSFWT